MIDGICAAMKAIAITATYRSQWFLPSWAFSKKFIIKSFKFKV